MYAGDIVEIGTSRRDVTTTPATPIPGRCCPVCPSWASRARTCIQHSTARRRTCSRRSKGDAFAPRNPQALKIDFVKRPPYFDGQPDPQGARPGCWTRAHPRWSRRRHIRNLLKAGGECKMAEEREAVLLQVKDLDSDLWLAAQKASPAVNNVNFDIYQGRDLRPGGRVRLAARPPSAGPSCASSPPPSGEILYEGQKINGKICRELDRQVIRRRSR